MIDTSDLSLRELRERIFARLGDVQGSDRLAIQLISFGYKHGVPLEADLVLDVRFMKNPHYIEGLRPKSGLTPEVREYVLGQPIAASFLARLHELLDLLVPAYVDEGKTRLTIKRFYATSAEEEYVTEDTLVEPGDVIRVPERWF